MSDESRYTQIDELRNINIPPSVSYQELITKSQSLSVQASSPFWEFTIPVGNWILYMEPFFSDVNTWIHLKTSASSTEILATHANSNSSASKVVGMNFTSNTNVRFVSDSAYNNQRLWIHVFGIKIR